MMPVGTKRINTLGGLFIAVFIVMGCSLFTPKGPATLPTLAPSDTATPRPASTAIPTPTPALRLQLVLPDGFSIRSSSADLGNVDPKRLLDYGSVERGMVAFLDVDAEGVEGKVMIIIYSDATEANYAYAGESAQILTQSPSEIRSLSAGMDAAWTIAVTEDYERVEMVATAAHCEAVIFGTLIGLFSEALTDLFLDLIGDTLAEITDC